MTAQRYGRAFAQAYDVFWNGFSTRFAPVIHSFVSEVGERKLLDLCCGTGQFARYFLEKGWAVTGLDLSRDMLRIADRRNDDFAAGGGWRSIRADAKDFRDIGAFPVVTSLFDALNHLDLESDLGSCFASTYDALCDSGIFIFDLNTKKGLKEWACFEVDDEDDLLVVKRGDFSEESGKAWLHLSGFSRVGSGGWERFKESFYNTWFRTERVVDLLKGAGFRSVELRKGDRSFAIVDEPEEEGRLFFVARK